VGRSFFNEQVARPCDLTGGLVAWRGYYQSLRPTQGGLTLNLGEDGLGEKLGLFHCFCYIIMDASSCHS
jgi:hypothetical protein